VELGATGIKEAVGQMILAIGIDGWTTCMVWIRLCLRPAYRASFD
jgi:hypothetical protein